MQPVIESLECRQMLSGSVSALHLHMGEKHAPAIHAPTRVSEPVNFAGTAVDSTGERTELLITVQRTDGGSKVQVHVMNNDGSSGTLLMKGNANGLITYNGNAGKDKITVRLQLSANGSSLTGTFSSLHKDGLTGTGTISLSKAVAAPVTFTGTSLDSKGETSQVVVTSTATVTGYVALVRVTSADGGHGGLVLTGDTAGHLVFDGPDGHEHLHVEAQLSADGRSITGTWTSVHADGSIGTGRFTVNRQ